MREHVSPALDVSAKPDTPDLPTGWVLARLRDILPLAYGKSLVKKSRVNSGSVPVYGSSGILGYHNESLVQGQSLIIGRKGTVGAVYFSNCFSWPIDTTYFATGTKSTYLRFFSYLLGFMNLGTLDRSTAIPGLNRDDYGDLRIALAPLPEQHRIVAEIEKQFSRLDASVAALKRAQVNLKRYRSSVLKAACEGKLVSTEAQLARDEGREYEPADRLLDRILVERRVQWASQPKRRGRYKEPAAPDTSALPELPEGWVWVTVGQLSARIQYGTSSKANSDPAGIPVLRMGNIQNGNLDFSDLKYLPARDSEVQKTLLDHGDLLFNRTNSAELVGKSAVFNGEMSPACFASYLIRVSFVDGFLPEFGCTYINSNHGRRYISQARSQQVGQANVNGTKLAAMPIPLPPLAEQLRIVAEVERRLSIIQQAEAAVEANLKRADRLRQSILKQAFTGKLVPQDPNDEPASVLLERIRSERAAAEAATAANRKSGRKGRSRRMACPHPQPLSQRERGDTT